MRDDLSHAFLELYQRQIDDAHARLDHCLDQLQDEDIWWTPREGNNSIGVIIQHLTGNLRQWAISGVGGEADVRERPAEFRAPQQKPKDELQNAFGDLLEQVKAVYARVSDAELLATRRIQGFDTTVLGAIAAAVCHLELHVGQIIYLTRLRLGDAYRETWVPTTKEEGA